MHILSFAWCISMCGSRTGLLVHLESLGLNYTETIAEHTGLGEHPTAFRSFSHELSAGQSTGWYLMLGLCETIFSAVLQDLIQGYRRIFKH